MTAISNKAVYIRLPESVYKDFRKSLVDNNESAQALISDFIISYIKSHKPVDSVTVI